MLNMSRKNIFRARNNEDHSYLTGNVLHVIGQKWDTKLQIPPEKLLHFPLFFCT